MMRLAGELPYFFVPAVACKPEETFPESHKHCFLKVPCPANQLKLHERLLFLKEILDAPQFLCYNVRANGRYRSFFYAQKTIAIR